jgi:trypsin
MRRLAPLVLALVLAPAAHASPRIVGGSDVPPGTFGFVANIDVAGAASCTGTLIAPTWVLTAAHCATPGGPVGAGSPTPLPGAAYTVTLDTVRTDGEGGEVRYVKDDGVHVPPGYFFTNGNGSDAALLELTEPATVAPMRIAAADERASWEPGDVMTVAGFGVTESGGDQPEVMQQTQVPITTDAYCASAYTDPTPILGDRFDPATEVCAGLPEGGKDSCQGDSGGPLLAPVGAGLRLVGATSRGNGCAEPGYPGIYARVAEGSLRTFVAGLVPEAFEPEGTPDDGGTPAPTPTPSPTPAPAAPSCAGATRVVLQVRPRSLLRRARVLVDGRVIVARRNVRKAFRVRLAPHLPRTGTAQVRVVMKPAGGKRTVVRRTYRDCRLKRTA